MQIKPTKQLVRESQEACERSGATRGTYTPVVFLPYEHIDGEKGAQLAFQSETLSGFPCTPII